MLVYDSIDKYSEYDNFSDIDWGTIVKDTTDAVRDIMLGKYNADVAEAQAKYGNPPAGSRSYDQNYYANLPGTKKDFMSKYGLLLVLGVFVLMFMMMMKK